MSSESGPVQIKQPSLKHLWEPGINKQLQREIELWKVGGTEYL